jgi:ppGpp synthetase/RelA/SpoT-type nucleotidyltranferase
MENSANIDNIVKEFEYKRQTYIDFGKKLSEFLKLELKKVGIDDAIIKDRAKGVDEFSKKIVRPGKKYSDPLSQITDLTGVRIIVYYTDLIKTVEEIIKREFEIDPENSIDKSTTYKPNTFGYLSMHKIISLNTIKQKQEEWKKFIGLKAEIQIRTSLQDAWATVSRALQYNQEDDVPDILKRKLFRLAGLFELCDEQFLFIKDETSRRLNELKQKIEAGNTKEIEIDFLSILQFLSSSTMMREAIGIANTYRILGNQEILEHYNRADCSIVTEECSRLGIKKIEQLEEILRKTVSSNEEFLKLISKGRVWKASNAFILFLLIIKSFPDKFEPNYLVKEYGWDYTVAKAVTDVSKQMRNKYNS